MNFQVLVLLMAGAACIIPGVGLAADDRVDYLVQIKPVLRERCFGCHGALKQEADLRLDTVASMIQGSSSGAVIVPGNASASALLERVATNDATERMPPEHEGEPLSDMQISSLRFRPSAVHSS